MTLFQYRLFEILAWLGIGTPYDNRIRNRLDDLERERWAADNPARVAAIRRVIARMASLRVGAVSA